MIYKTSFSNCTLLHGRNTLTTKVFVIRNLCLNIPNKKGCKKAVLKTAYANQERSIFCHASQFN